MEVMSSLLFCALAALGALASQALGKQVLRTSANDILFNNTVLIHQKNKHKLLLNLNGQPLVSKISELHTVYTDYNCNKCMECMNRALKAQRLGQVEINNSIEPHELVKDSRLAEAIKSHREKRSANKSGEKKTKHKKSKSNKQVAITKFTVHGVIKAIKVKEFATTHEESSCEVFNVETYYPCNSSEGDAMIAELQRHGKKSKRDSLLSSTPPLETTKRPQVVYRKREVDNSQLPENIMPSFEELY